ncbi:hypothetical protein B0H16DRAFT_1467593 [Mycena metata]|uniref:Uncharacterized protein n=1 Tax=Mycena metata TaxID=1033252 RepID=A0AAD7MX07_9AGAR|nr:hypothetical protein B0H16DRAFT_1467593 [Mycena metata]
MPARLPSLLEYMGISTNVNGSTTASADSAGQEEGRGGYRESDGEGEEGSREGGEDAEKAAEKDAEKKRKEAEKATKAAATKAENERKAQAKREAAELKKFTAPARTKKTNKRKGGENDTLKIGHSDKPHVFLTHTPHPSDPVPNRFRLTVVQCSRSFHPSPMLVKTRPPVVLHT